MTSSQTDWYLYVQNGPLAGSSLALQLGMQTIGRDPANQIAISDSQISRTHAQITVEEKYADYVNRVARSVNMSKTLTGETKVMLDVIIDAFNEELAKGE